MDGFPAYLPDEFKQYLGSSLKIFPRQTQSAKILQNILQ
jgi:hypothetical protein